MWFNIKKVISLDKKRGVNLLVIIMLLLVGALLRTIYLGTMDLFVDEAYYWDWSRKLDFGYYSHPPMVAWLIFLGRTLLGNTETGIRIPFAMLGITVILLTYFL